MCQVNIVTVVQTGLWQTEHAHADRYSEAVQSCEHDQQLPPKESLTALLGYINANAFRVGEDSP